eukprot:TRINITY_DN26250_c0_g1_i1.p1 TRINITY_DN26250_c0_g1~~TRINITY_DN26250_c0_g1_i1.p1  ORF type:complete len:406 (+),score=100.17 TRINITY_DN26250_c0_g1_i1:57-1220(+)
MAVVDNGLPVISPPREFDGFGLDDAILHWMGRVVRYDEHWGEEVCVVIVTDECLYVCTDQGKVTQCIGVGAILELLAGESPGAPPMLGLRLWQQPEYDLLLGFPQGAAERQRLAHVLCVTHDHNTRGQAGPLAVIHAPELVRGGSLAGVLSLAQPAGWQLLIEPIKSKRHADRPKQAPRPAHESEVDAVIAAELDRVASGLGLQLQHEFGLAAEPSRKPLRGSGGDTREDLLRSELGQAREQLRVCRGALQDALRKQSNEIDAIRDQFLEYDKEIVAYLNRVYTAFPSARPALGSPPRLPPRLQHGDTSGGSLPSPQGLVEENARLRERLRELDRARGPHALESRPSAAEARRDAPVPWPSRGEQYLPPASLSVGGGMGPGGFGHRQ